MIYYKNSIKEILRVIDKLLFPRWELFIPTLGIFCSQGGNKYLARGLNSHPRRQPYLTIREGY